MLMVRRSFYAYAEAYCDLSFQVLTSDKSKGENINKGKDHEMAKWDAEVRKSLANKRLTGAASGATETLTKQQQALVNAQLVEEEKIRARVIAVKAGLLRGLAVVQSLVASGTEEFRGSISEVVVLLLEGVLGCGAGILLAGGEAVETYLVRGLLMFRSVMF